MNENIILRSGEGSRIQRFRDFLFAAVRLIHAKKSSGIAAPASMEAIWNWEHGKMIEKTAHVHRLLDMLKG